MDNTRDTIISLSKIHPSKLIKADNELGKDVKEEFRPKPRFKKGDILVSAYASQNAFELDRDPYWDIEFGGWLISPALIGIHECNFIKASEKDLWEPYPNGLWSYWKRKRS